MKSTIELNTKPSILVTPTNVPYPFDVKDIIRELSVDDCFAGPEKDRDPQYNGWIFKFSSLFEGTKLYIKIRVESIEKSVCLSVHEFGKYDEVN